MPTSASWVNAVESFFARLSKRRLERGVFRSLVDLQAAAINRFVDEHNRNHPKLFTWTADPDKIIPAVKRGHQVLVRPFRQPVYATSNLIDAFDGGKLVKRGAKCGIK